MCVLIQENLYLEMSQTFYFGARTSKNLSQEFPAIEDRNKAGHSLKSFFHFVLDLVWR